MRIMVILNPTNKYGTKTAYTKLRTFLLNDGYYRISQEVFMRVVSGRKGCKKHLERLKKYSPKTGNVMIFTFTETQYKDHIELTGNYSLQEIQVGAYHHITL